MNVRLVLLFLAQALAVGATNSSLVLGSIISSQLGREALAGLPATFNTLAAALSAYPFGLLMARLGWRSGLIGAYLLGALGALIGFTGARSGLFWLFLLGCALMGAAQGGYQQGRYVAAASVRPERRAAALSLLLFMSVLGSALAAVLAPVLARMAVSFATSSEVLGWSLAAVLLLLSAALTLGWPAEQRPPKSVAASGTSRDAWKTNPVRVAALSLAVAQGVMVTLMVLTPLRAHHLGMHHASVAGLLTLHFVGMFGFAWAVGPLIDRLGVRFGLISGSLLFVVAALLLPLTDSVALTGSIFALGLGWNLCYVSGSSLMATHRQAQGSVEALTYLSAGLGALGGSVIVAQAGFSALALVGGVLGLLPAVASLSLGRRVPALG
ncbi:MFS transporter [Deinococcus peraridilitoris]|uniref:Arabinose efflux permease family protein n=1 Tax=Deinococcus peraridilitoris (strain DSM 19664 / LMG 22246 / CIP 109416 / KR-200) TaxID=937777 RepID=K9ZYU0_DEIPD|nr:MFS transporter [Deinococcus peraridilitoris]AFZ65925.1 arabinose efflux permease family protein [Deinococcus peraridilitoris DSM 19664]